MNHGRKSEWGSLMGSGLGRENVDAHYGDAHYGDAHYRSAHYRDAHSSGLKLRLHDHHHQL